MSSCAKWYISISVRGRIFSHITASIDDIETQQQQHQQKKVYKRFWPSTNVSLLLSFTLSYALSEWTLENLFGCVCGAQAFEWTATGCSCAALTAGDKGEQNSVSLCVRCALIWQILYRTVLTANSTRVASHPRFHLRRVWERKRERLITKNGSFVGDSEFLPHTSFHWILLSSLLVRHRGIRFCFLVTPILCVIDDKQFAWLPHDRPQTTSYRQNYIYLSIGHRCYIRVISLVVCVLCCGATTSEFHQFLLYIDIENVYIGTVKEQ